MLQQTGAVPGQEKVAVICTTDTHRGYRTGQRSDEFCQARMPAAADNTSVGAVLNTLWRSTSTRPVAQIEHKVNTLPQLTEWAAGQCVSKKCPV